ncbi:MAG: thioredoxin domain-containing protein [Polyangiaceae bacterium]
MLGANLKASLLFLAMGSSVLGSTCHGQSNGTDVSKDPAPATDTVSIGGVDTSALTPRERSEWSTYVSEFLAPCADTPVPIAQCVNEKRSCAKCLPAAKYVLKGVRDGMSREQIEKSFHNRFDADKIKSVPIEGSPTRGPDSAPITIIEFADFECPFCAMISPILDKTWTDKKTQIRFVYKFLPLSGHPHGDIAARAGFAAWQQGKFWEMNHTMFANREHLEQSDLESYAKELGLDLAKFKGDMQSQAATDRIAQDRKLADSLQVAGTPTIYINGRDYDVHQDLNDWVNLELSSLPGDQPTRPTADKAAPADAGKAAPPRGAKDASK